MAQDHRLYPKGPYSYSTMEFDLVNFISNLKMHFAYFIVKLLIYSFTAAQLFRGNLIPDFIFLLLLITTASVVSELHVAQHFTSAKRRPSYSVYSLNNYRSLLY